jgi:transcriptional regulator with XRE-family HTH domain
LLLSKAEANVSQAVELPSPRLELKRAIGATGLPAWKVGHLAGVSPTTLSHICTGRRDPSQDEAGRLAAALEADVGALFPDLGQAA